MRTFKYISFFLLLFLFLGCKNKKEITDAYSKNKEFKTHFHDANAEKMIGHYEKSIVLFEKCISIDPNSAASYFGLSQIYFKTKQNQKAIETGKKAIALNSKNKWYYIHLSEVYFSIGNYLESSQYLENVFQNFEEKNIDYRYQLAQCYISLNEFNKAINELNIIENEYGKTPEISITKHDLYVELKEFDKAKNEIQALFKEYPNDIELRLMITDFYLQSNQIEEAEKIAKSILTIEPDNGNAFLALADVEIRKNNIDLSFDYIEKGFYSPKVEMDRKLDLISGLMPYCFEHRDPNVDKINERMGKLLLMMHQLNTKDAKFYLLYGTYLEKNNLYHDAREKFALSSELDGSDYISWNQLLNMDLKIENYTLLLNDAEKSIEYFPSQPLFYLFAGIGAYEIKKFESADEFLFMGKNLVVKDPALKNEFEYHIGISYLKQNQITEAQNHFEKLLINQADVAIFNFGLSKVYYEKKDLMNAEIYAKKTIDIENNNAIYLFEYGKLLYLNKKLTESKKILYKAVSIAYTNYSYLELYGDVLYQLNEIDKAIEFWKESIKQGNNSELIEKKVSDKKFYEK